VLLDAAGGGVSDGTSTLHPLQSDHANATSASMYEDCLQGTKLCLGEAVLRCDPDDWKCNGLFEGKRGRHAMNVPGVTPGTRA
jgi:hypothetical protein